ncbi:hypothetical protein M9435_003240 [Picochlorum sp. BPE23]|nr:hypothetical protein M9435_003240 [Picochlorum sp. BPE23]
MAQVHPSMRSDPSALRRSVDARLVVTRVVDDSEFPYHSGEINGVKCCTKCAATKTPQWREGPYGPKTLCNACGVKRTRKLRAEQDGGKRKRSNGGQGNAKVKVVRGTSQALEQHPVLPPTEDFVKRPSHQLQGQNSINSGKIGADAVRRPTRKAAEEAAFRTARYAKTGEWGNLNSSSPMKKSMFKFDVNGNQTGSSSSDVISGPFSDVPEETAWMPHEKVVGGGSSPYTPDCAVRTSDDCFAAINLMTMSAKNSLEDTFFSQPRHGTPESSPLKMYPSNADVEAALNKVADLCGGVFSDSNISILSQSVPPSKVSDLIKLTDELSDMQHTVSEAETEVSALAAMLAVKQAALLEKQYRASMSTEKLRRFVYELETQFGLTYKVLPKIRVACMSPTLKKTNSI